jgi:hypothetical protein
MDMGSAAPTAVFPSPADTPVRPRIVTLTFLAVAAAAFLIGIAIATTMRDASTGVVVASQRAAPSGGTIRFDGGELRIPAGALASPTRIVIRRTVVPDRVQVRPPRGPVQIFQPRELVAYIFEPADVDFLRPVTLMFRLRDQSGGGTAFARVGEATLLLGGVVDDERRTLSVEISDFRFTRGQPIGADR